MTEAIPEEWDTYVFDLSKMYPNIIRTMKISPELVVHESSENTIDIEFATKTLHLSREEEGFLPKMLEKMFKMRERIENEMKKYDVDSEEYEILSRRVAGIKRVINSVYGMLTYYKSRYFLPILIPDADLLGMAVTKVGRELIDWSKKIAEEFGYKVIYIDTDSIFVRGIENVEEAYQLQEMINKSYSQFAQQWDLDEHHFLIEFEKVYDSLLIKTGKKKRYVGMLSWKDGEFLEENKFDVSGFEIVRSDSTEWTADFQKEHFKRALQGVSEEEMYEWCTGKIDEIESGDIDWFEIAIPKGIGKPLDKYKSEGAHVKGAKYSNKHLDTNFSEGDKPRYIYIDKTPRGYPDTHVICIDNSTEIPDGFELDMERMVKRIMLSKLDTVDEALGWNLEQDLVLYMEDQSKLDDFMDFGDDTDDVSMEIGQEVKVSEGEVDKIEDVFPDDELLKTVDNGYLSFDEVEVVK